MKILNSLRFGIVALLSILIFSCKDKSTNSWQPSVTGSAFDVLVVGSPKIWQSPEGKALFDILNRDMPGLPQSEPMFTISFTSDKDFPSFLRPVRNIIMFNIDEGIYTQGRISYSRNKWAKPQAIVTVTAPNVQEFVRIVTEKQDEFIAFFEEAERNRALAYFSRYSNKDGAKLVKEQFGVQMTLPSALNKSKTGKDFLWFSNTSYDLRQDIIIYRYPYHGPEDFNLENLLQKRDSVLKANVEGPSPNSFMTTEHRFNVTHKAMNVNGVYSVVLRGLWRVEGDLMGGPFVSKSYLDKKHNEIITVEGFIYGPSHKKRNPLRQLESVIYSLEFPR
ncbi:MAG: DUF4837 family protein [Prevotellaceae bacterium]|jgi:hypothetical protein|nr:DUF4837 family protein [Prevotellaceae bacterium]